MTHELLVLRHAKSAWDTGARTDFERPLSKRGLRDAPRMGRFLADEGLVPDHVVSSPAERARQTVIAVCAELGFDDGAIRWDERVYHATTGALMDVLAESPPGARRVLIAGHNPGLMLAFQQFADALFRQGQHGVQFLLAEGMALGRALYLDEIAGVANPGMPEFAVV